MRSRKLSSARGNVSVIAGGCARAIRVRANRLHSQMGREHVGVLQVLLLQDRLHLVLFTFVNSGWDVSWAPGESVWLRVQFSWSVCDLEVELSKELGPPCLNVA